MLGECGWLAGLDARSYDLAVRNRFPLPGASRVAVVLIDDISIKKLGRWPWPWTRHAEFVRTLNQHYHPAAIAFDLLFAEPDPQDENHEFARALREAGNVYLAAFLTGTVEAGEKRGEARWLAADYVEGARWEGKHYAAMRPPARELALAAAGVGPVNVVPELDGCIRRIPMVADHEGKPYPSLAAVVVNSLVNPDRKPVRAQPGTMVDFGGYQVPVDQAGEILVSYHPAPESESGRQIVRARYESVLARAVPVADLKGKAVLVGFAAAGMADVHPTPLNPGSFGVDINAQAINSILQGSFLRGAEWPGRMGAALVLGVLTALIACRCSPARAVGIALTVVALGLAAAGLLLWVRGVWVGVAVPAMAALLAYSITAAQRYRQSETDSLRVQASVDMLAQATRMIGSVRQRAQVLTEIRNQITDAIGARQTNLYLRDETRERFRLERDGQGDDGSQVASYEVGEATVGWVAQHGTAHLIGRLQRGSTVAEELARSVRFPVVSAAFAPLSVRGEVLGVVEAVRAAGDAPFQLEHLTMLSALADEAAVALENTTLYEQLSGKVEIANRQLVGLYGELRQERDRVAAIVSNMADGVMLTDAQARIAFLNPAAAAMFGMEAREVEGELAAAKLPYPALAAQLADHPEEAEPAIPMIRIEEPHRLVLSPRTVHLVDENGVRTGAITVLTDITLLQELSEMKTEFVSLVSHELRTPLTSIMGFAETLHGSSHRLPPEMQDEFLGIIEQESNRLLVMINDLLDVSRMEAGRKLGMNYSRLDLKQVAEDVVRFQRVTTTRHEFVFDFPGDGLWAEADRDKVIQILTNFLSNAIKYSPAGGEVTVGGIVQGEEAVLRVADKGVGMTPEEVAKLFQRYQRVDRDAIKGIRGTGLGLYLVRGLADAHGGRIWVESEPGVGSTFYFALPRSRAVEQVWNLPHSGGQACG